MSIPKKTYLFTWNPSLWKWEDLNKNINEVNNHGITIHKWAVASHKKLKIGDRAFLIKLGKKDKGPKGIMASGYIETESFLGPHWNGVSDDIYYTVIAFDTILDFEKQDLLFLETLRAKISKTYNWTPRNCGIEINNDITKLLEEFWFEISIKQNFINSFLHVKPSIVIATT